MKWSFTELPIGLDTHTEDVLGDPKQKGHGGAGRQNEVSNKLTKEKLGKGMRLLDDQILDKEMQFDRASFRHTGTRGNEIADQAARQEMASDITDVPLRLEDAKATLKQNVSQLRQKEWNSSNLFKPTIQTWSLPSLTHREQVALTRIRIGHTFPTHSHPLLGNPPPICERNTLTSLNGDPIRFRHARGCPQGGLLSPLLGTVPVDDMLEEFSVRGVDVLCYVDDLATLVRGKYEDTISEYLQQALNIINSWGKTILTRKSHVGPPTVVESPSVKLLGININNSTPRYDNVDTIAKP
nr:unnamed protein product [Callosobruchus analis]